MTAHLRFVIKVPLSFILWTSMLYVADAQITLRPGTTPPATRPNESDRSGQSLIDVLTGLEHTRNVSFAYQKKYLENRLPVRKSAPDENLDAYLTDILLPLSLAFKKIPNAGGGNIYVIYPVAHAAGVHAADSVRNAGRHQPPPSDSALTAANTVYGMVRGKRDGSGLPGVNIVVKGTTIGTVTDERGNYVLEIPDKKNGTLVFSFVGFEPQEVPVQSRNLVNIELNESAHQLSEIIVTALGISRNEKALGYAVSTLHAGEITSSGNTNVTSALYGKAPGVRIRTAPGGATSAVAVQIRGFNSLNYNTQPLYVIDGIVMRDANENGSTGVNNEDYWADPRIRGNGILDVNPADVESITVLKGASATALYGSDAASGVVVINTKKGSAYAGLGIDVNYTFNIEQVAFTPRFQNKYGPGFDRAQNISLGADADGWVPVDINGDGTVDGKRPMFESNAQFGPALDGREVYWWDGEIRKYAPQPDNYKDFYRTGYNSVFNVALGNSTDHAAYRVSYTRSDYQGIQAGGKMERNTFDFNSTFQVNDRLSTDVVMHYYNSYVHNRPVKINRLRASWTGYFSRAEYMSLFFDKYRTSAGYKWVPYDQAQRNPAEALHFVTPRGYEVMDLLWTQLRNHEEEFQHRLISSFTLNYNLLNDLTLRARIGNDFTSLEKETREYNEYPVIFNGNSSTGSYRNATGRYDIFYTDALLMYSKELSPEVNLSVNGGFQWKDEKYKDQHVGTSGGLAVENWFSLSNSYNAAKSTDLSRSSILKYAYLGILNLSYKDYLFVEATGRKEYSSTLPPGANSYFYPSVNTGFVFSEAFRLPALINYGKFRAAYGVVGNAPPVYESNILYELSTLQTVNGSVVSALPQGTLFGNDNILPERNFELEFGLDTRMFHNKIGIDLTWYDSRVVNQILRLDLPTTTGAERILTNIGELHSNGWELGVNAVPVSGIFGWKLGLNAAYNVTKVHHLGAGLDRLVFRDLQGSAIQVVAEEGRKIGNVYVYPIKEDAGGNRIVNSKGLYTIDKTRYAKAGNILPAYTGGLYNTFSYRSFSLNLMLDYSLGGQIVSLPLKYGTGSGLYAGTLKYRDARNGGLPYYIDNAGAKVLLPGHDAPSPDGSPVYHDGVILKGVTEEGAPNTTIVDAATYYINMFDWGDNAWNEKGAIYDNSYVKLREVVLSYTLPGRMAERLHFRNVRISLIGRNLYYLWKTLENLDPEATIGTNWVSQGIDDGSGDSSRSYGFSINLGL